MSNRHIRIYCLLFLALAIGFVGVTRARGIGRSARADGSRRNTLHGPGTLTSFAGSWVLPAGQSVEVEVVNTGLRARINGVEWELAPEAESFSGARMLTRDDARELFPEIGDAPSFLSNRLANLALAPGQSGDMIALSLSIQVLRPGGQGFDNVQLLSGSLTHAAVAAGQAGTAGSLGANTSIGPQALGTPAVAVKPSLAPNLFGSPSFAAYTANALAALQNGLSSMGNPATSPAGYA
ncbi:MAG: hypothetical protein ACREDR_11070, partial [Blastocatellia bacterium]